MLAPRKARPAKALLNGKGALKKDSDFEDILLPRDADLESYFKVGCSKRLHEVVANGLSTMY